MRRRRAGNRPLQEFKKISILEAKGYGYGWHFYKAGDADLVVASEDTLFGHPSFRYAGWGPRLWSGGDHGPAQVPGDAVYRPCTGCHVEDILVRREAFAEATRAFRGRGKWS